MEEIPLLTARFSEIERVALERFWTKLVNDEEVPKSFTLWGVTIDLQQPAADPTTSVILMKFLRARGLYQDDARDILVKTLDWRTEFNAESLLTEKFPNDVFGNVGQVFGNDKDGRPIVYYRHSGNTDSEAVFGDNERCLRWRVALIEKSIRQLDFVRVDQIVEIYDYACAALTSPLHGGLASQLILILRDYYPEFSYMKFFINVPTLFERLFWIYERVVFAPKLTLARISVLGTDNKAIEDALEQLIDRGTLSRRYGGGTVVFSDDANWVRKASS